MRRMTRRTLAIYVAVLALYEGLLSASYASSRIQIPVTLDPRFAVNWLFAHQLDQIPFQLTLVLLGSLLWHGVAAIGLVRSSAMVSVFAIGETLLAVPSVIVFGSALLGLGGHGFSGATVALSAVVFAICSAIPLLVAYSLLVPCRQTGRSVPG